MAGNDYTSYERRQRHREEMLRLCKRLVGFRVRVAFTPLGENGRSLGKHFESGTIVGVGASQTLRVNNAVVLLRDHPDDEGRTLSMVNTRQINNIERLTFSPLDIEDLMSEIMGGQSG